ncbi:MAG: hypothetical protein HKN43_13580 [Rhodothermales bacterium]|nr:hypothetical protein [Rhodothermales bacterium]
MRKKALTRFQLFALVLVTGLVLFRVFSGPPAPRGTVTINRVEPSELKHVAFSLDAPVTFAVEAVGSLASVDARDAEDLAVYGWILDRNSRTVVWKMQDTRIRRNQTLATVEDTLTLASGTYDMYFTSYGNLVDPGRRGQILGVAFGDDWIADADEWRLLLNVVDDESEQHVTVLSKKDESTAVDGATGQKVFWATGPVSSKGTKQHIFEVVESVTIEVYAVGEYCSSGCDWGGIIDYATGDTLWQLELINSKAAGGMQENISFRGDVSLERGTYRAFYESDRGHLFGDWYANPPFDPSGWGMTISLKSSADSRRVQTFDPWTQREPLMSITQVGSDENRRIPFSVSDTVSVLVYAVGEMNGSGSRYDFATIRNVTTGDKYWEMTYKESEPAGGYETNRKSVVVLDLVPGRYELAYQTDGSHDYDRFSNGEPDNPDRWGVTVFAFDEASAQEAISVQRVEVAQPVPEGNDFEFDAGEVVVNATQLGNDVSIMRALSIADLSLVRIVAVGEISSGGQYDYGWIENTESGNVVWEMTRRNTVHAGGDDHNRRFEGVVELTPGEYIVHFKTDFTHAFGDFGDGAPDNPAEWGIRVEKILSSG